MGKYTFNLPDIGEGIAEAEIVAWHVKPGDRIEEDGRIADMMTDKATVEMESPVAGVVLSVAGDVGDVIAIGSALVVIETEDEDEGDGKSEVAPAATPAPAPVATPAPAPKVEAAPVVETPVAEPVVEAPVTAAPAAAPSAKVLASPAVRQRARDLGIDLGQVKASGNHVRHADLDAFLTYNAGQGYRAPGSFLVLPAAGSSQPESTLQPARRQ